MAKKRKKAGAKRKKKRKLPPNAPRFVKKLASGKCPLTWEGRKVERVKFKKKSGFVCSALPK